MSSATLATWLADWGLPDRFWAKVEKTDSCWLWTAGTDADGYGSFTFFKGHYERVHRTAWERSHQRKIPPGMCVLHTCDRRNCIQPDHLFLGTHQDNQADKVAKGRQAKGTRSRRAKLTEAQVVEIFMRLRSGGKVADLARSFGVGPMCIYQIRTGRYWSWLTANL